MVETELKFQVPVAWRSAVKRRLATGTARTLALRAMYFDTPDRRLAQAGLALRLRKEGRQWVQALKGPGPGMGTLHRLEHEVPVQAPAQTPTPAPRDVPTDAAGTEPTVDIARHAGTAAGQALARAFGDGAEPLQLVFETRVQRTWRVVRHDGALVELALDIGEVIAGPRRLPIWELEFELKRGAVDGLLAQAARWVERHGLWLDVRSKAERGMRLAGGLDVGPAVSAKDVSIAASASADTALRTIVGACLAQVLPNGADVAAGVAGPEHLHQLRVGLRRLRCALRVFGDLSDAARPSWAPALAELFASLGTSRDRDVLAESVLPALRQAGAPLIELPPDAETVDPGEAIRGKACNRLLLELIGFAQGPATPGAGSTETPPRPIATIVAPRLRHLRHQVKDDAAAFETFDDAHRHRTRKRLKRLRYSVKFFATLFSARSLKHWLAQVREAQEALGRLNDLAVAEAAFRALLPQDGRAGFALDWLGARRTESIPRARSALVKLAKTALTLRDEAALRPGAGKGRRHGQR
jgi:triphosphatase